MKITSIELAGRSRTTLSDGQPGLPRAFARLSRRQGDEHINVELIMPGSERTHRVQADDPDDQLSMAQIIQQALDGYEGTNGDIDEYFHIVQMLGD